LSYGVAEPASDVTEYVVAAPAIRFSIQHAVQSLLVAPEHDLVLLIGRPAVIVRVSVRGLTLALVPFDCQEQVRGWKFFPS